MTIATSRGTSPAGTGRGAASRTGTGWGRIGGKYTILDMTDLRTAIIDTGRAG